MFALSRHPLLPATLLCVGAITAPLRAQVTDSVPPPLGGSVRLLSAQPIGEFKRYVNNGWGAGADVRWFPGAQRVASLRVDAAYVNYGRQTTRECFGTSCRIQIDINTSNNIFSGLVGPEVQAPVGPVRPYVNALAGWTVFWTQSSAEGADDEEDVFRTTNLRDNLFTAAVGGGFRIPLGSQVKLDLNARRNFNGRARYLTRDSFGDGTLPTPLVRESEVNMWIYSVGVAFGF
ncbi:MAG: hypothetical protein V4813_18925 [Gemmatimonadota bacterium]